MKKMNMKIIILKKNHMKKTIAESEFAAKKGFRKAKFNKRESEPNI